MVEVSKPWLTLVIAALVFISGCIGQQGAQEKPILTMPSNAVKLSECKPNMGEHWANPADLPFGPMYLVDTGEVIGIEYHMREDELEKNILNIAGEQIGKPAVMPTLGVEYDHVELNYMPEGHAGDTEPHYDVHMFLITPQEQQQLCK